MNRRQFLQGSLVLLGLSACGRRPGLVGQRMSPNYEAGHRLRDGHLPQTISAHRQVPTAILGGGIAGLSAAWKLVRSGYRDFTVFELEKQPGGNARWADYPASATPLAAHYLPVPTRESRAVRELLSEMGLYQGDDPDGTPRYSSRHLCHSPHERLFQHSRWHQGLFPGAGAKPEDFEQWEHFQAHIEGWKKWRDSQGRKAFALPLAYSSPELFHLDRQNFADYAQQHGWTGEPMRWFLEYACRDDYGTRLETTSAWAGLHYFASRDGGGFSDPDALFVWPEGNGRLVQHMLTRFTGQVELERLVVSVRPGQGFDYLDLSTGERVRVEAEQMVYALPTFTRPYTLGEPSRPEFSYSPWVTANLVFGRYPEEGALGAPLCWDNVLFDSPSLGYVVDTHQSLSAHPARPAVFTWYRPLVDHQPTVHRKALLKTDWAHWRDVILDEMTPLYPKLLDDLERLDVTLFGHAMVRPTPGFLWGPSRLKAVQAEANLSFAHSDLSGISVFEEAQYQGVRAAQEVMDRLGHPYTPSV